MSFEFSGFTVRLILLALVALTVVMIFVFRKFLQKLSTTNLTAKYKGKVWKSPLVGRNKYPEVDTFQFRNAFLEYGLLVSLLLMILAFSWTSYDERMDVSHLFGTLSEDIEMEIPRTAEPPPPPPPPQAANIQILASDMPDVQTVVFEDMSFDAQSEVIAAPVQEVKREAAPPPPPPPPPVMDTEREIFRVVEVNPLFPGCESVIDKEEQRRCAEEKMLQFIYSNIKYPNIARENGVEGMVVVQFVVEKDGSISNITTVRDIGAGCGDEAKRIVAMMPTWNPGRQRDRPVRVMFTLPVRFKLE